MENYIIMETKENLLEQIEQLKTSLKGKEDKLYKLERLVQLKNAVVELNNEISEIALAEFQPKLNRGYKIESDNIWWEWDDYILRGDVQKLKWTDRFAIVGDKPLVPKIDVDNLQDERYVNIVSEEIKKFMINVRSELILSYQKEISEIEAEVGYEEPTEPENEEPTTDSNPDSETTSADSNETPSEPENTEEPIIEEGNTEENE